MSDIDPVETAEWREALESVMEFDGEPRTAYLLEQLLDEATRDLTTKEHELAELRTQTRRASKRAARDEEVMIYGIGLETEFFNGQSNVRSKPDSILNRFALETGGGYFELKKTSELASTFTRVVQELHSQYALAFVAPRLDNKVHKLTVKLKQPGMTARARKSYLASAGDPSDR